jgi:hypothetical protein
MSRKSVEEMFLSEVKNTFAMEAFTNEGDTLWIGIAEDADNDTYCLASATDGDLYYDESLTSVLTYLLMNYQISKADCDRLYDFTRKYC